MEDDRSIDPPAEPNCRRCGRNLRTHLRSELIDAPDGAGEKRSRRCAIAYCSGCGEVLYLSVQPTGVAWGASGPERTVRTDPTDSSPSGWFQRRCHDLVVEIQGLGFSPGGWIGLINRHGAAEAAKQLLAEGRVLPVTRWLIDRDHPELTMEAAVCDPEWRDLFSDNERVVAARRLHIGS